MWEYFLPNTTIFKFIYQIIIAFKICNLSQHPSIYLFACLFNSYRDKLFIRFFIHLSIYLFLSFNSSSSIELYWSLARRLFQVQYRNKMKDFLHKKNTFKFHLVTVTVKFTSNYVSRKMAEHTCHARTSFKNLE